MVGIGRHIVRATIAALCFSLVAVLPVRAMEIERVVSPGGIEAWLVQEDSVPVVVMEVAWKGGAAIDPEGKSGLASMVSGLLDEGAGELGSAAFQIRMQDIAARMSFSSDSDYFSGTLTTLANRKDEAFELFAMAISEPRFDEDAVARIRGQIATSIARNRQSPDWIASNGWYNAAFGDHPYARDGDGTPESIAAIERADLVAFTKNALAMSNLKIAVVGPVTPSELRSLLDRTFGGLPREAQIAEIPKVEVKKDGEVTVVVRDFPQSVVLFGLEGVSREDPDFIPAYVMNYILGGGSFSSRLTEEVREKRGLAYSIGTYLYPMDSAAMLLGQVGTKNERVGQTLSLIRQEMARMAQEGVTADQLDDAKTYLTGSYPLRFTSNRSIASQLLGIQIAGYGIDYVDGRNALIEAVTREDVARVARRLLKPDELLVTIVGKPNLSPEPEGLPATDDMAPPPPGGPTEGHH
ncbi:MAG: peptidase M16 [Alphaproteobacteria bacterium HGW-Alphaproteobacteria-3]|nr:MAG: peptidase M16 [Alphaproteobacteria bacterium HGW-Alphaproteobacteria-3]